MNKKFILVFFLTLLVVSFIAPLALAQDKDVNVYYFGRTGCSHCKNVEDSGILDRIANKAVVTKYDIALTQEARDKFTFFADGFGIPENQRGTPLLVIEKNGQYSYLEGDTPIINTLETSIDHFTPVPFNQKTNDNFILGAVIVGALADAFNPCAFGVLIFLMVGLLKLGSSKRALKAGLLYTLVVFVAYLLIGIGIIQILPFLNQLTYLYVIIGAILAIGALIEIKDFFWYDKGISLKIPLSAKPTIEKLISKGTLPAIFLLGIFVSLVEAPCTGGPYLAVLTLLAAHKALGIGYLVLYNIIFVLPLLIITLAIYMGERIEAIKNWVEANKRLMRLITGIIMLVFAVYFITQGL